MTFEEKSTWVFGVVAVVGYVVYLALVLPQLGDPIGEVAYQWPMAGTILGGIAAGIVGGILVGMSSPKEAGKADQRDKEIDRFGNRVGQSFVVIGAVGALVLALLSAEHFWIANTLYLGFVLSAVLTVIAKLVAYRRGFQPW